MPVKLNGSTSGYVQIDAPAVAGATQITLPAVTGGSFIVSDSSGNVGIGTTSPNYTLDVRATTGSIAATSNTGTNFAKLQCINSGGSYQFGIDNSAGSNFGSGTAYSRVIWNDSSTAPTILYTNSTERMRIDSSGNVGIGTSSPGAKLGVNGAVRVSGTLLVYSQNSANLTGLSTNAMVLGTVAKNVAPSGNQGTFLISSDDPSASCLQGTISLFTNSTAANRRLAIGAVEQGTAYRNITLNEDGGLVLVNQASAAGNNAQFQVSSSTTNAGQFIVTTSPAYPLVASQNGSGSGLIYFNYNATNIGTISTNGTSTSYNVTSDYRLKNTVIPLTNGLDTVSALKPVTYKWNADNSDGDGFIAHELQSIVPAAVVGEKDAVDADGKPIYQGVDYSKIVVHLVAAIQELSAKNDALETRLVALESK